MQALSTTNPGVLFFINIAKDKEETHSNSFYNKCIKLLKCIYVLIKLGTSERLDTAKLCPLCGDKLWTGFIEELSVHQCQSCSHYLTQNNPVAKYTHNIVTSGVLDIVTSEVLKNCQIRSPRHCHIRSP